MTGDLFEGMRRARILIPDNTPLSLLSAVGREALDWLFVTGAEVWVTDLVFEEAMRAPDDGSDPRAAQRRDLAEWFEANRHRIRIQGTDEGDEYRKAMEAWRKVPGSPIELKPSWRNRGEKSVLQILDGVEKILASGEAVVAIVDDRKARAAIKILENADIDLMSTETYLVWITERFSVREAANAWTAIRLALDGKAPNAPSEDPVHVHSFRMK